MSITGAFTDEFGPEFDVYNSVPSPIENPIINWRLSVRVFGIDADVSSVTRFDFSVESGRDDPDEQPQPGRAMFNVDVTGSERAWWAVPGLPIWLEAELGRGDERVWYRVWTGTITEVRRRFSYDDAGNPRNEVTIDAAGPLAALERLKVPPGIYGAFPEQLDGVRVWGLLYMLGLPMSLVRPESGHIVNDELPEHSSRWDRVTQTVTGSTAATFTRSAAIPAITGAGAVNRRVEVVVTLTTTRAAVVAIILAGQLVELVYQRSGTYAVTAGIALPADAASPTLSVWVIPQDEGWAELRWSDLDSGLQWSSLPVDRQWNAAPGAGVSTTVTLHTVDLWRTGWDWGSVWLIARDPNEHTDQTARDHVEEIGRAARGTLWEQRDGGLAWASQLSRAPDVQPSLDLPSRYVEAATDSVVSLSGLVNSVTVEYGWSGMDAAGNPIPRPSITQTDQGSIASFGGTFDTTITGPLRDRASAVAVAQAVLRASSRPRERINQLTTIPLEWMDDLTVLALLTITPGSLIEVEATPAAGWIPAAGGRWQGFLEGWTLTGSAGRRVTATLALSEWFEGVSTLVDNYGQPLKAHPG